MESRASLYYQALLEADPITQIGNVFLLPLTLFLLWKLLHSVYLIAGGKLQKASVIGFKRRVWSFGQLLLPSYDPVISYKDRDGREKQASLKRIPPKNITAIDVFVSSKEARFIDLNNIGVYLLVFGILITMIWLPIFSSIDLPSEKIILGIVFVMLILVFRSDSQFHYADKSFLGLRVWQQIKRDKEITKTKLEEAEYQRLITPDKLLTYEEAKRLESKEGNWKDILAIALMILCTGFMVWLGHSE